MRSRPRREIASARVSARTGARVAIEANRGRSDEVGLTDEMTCRFGHTREQHSRVLHIRKAPVARAHRCVTAHRACVLLRALHLGRARGWFGRYLRRLTR